MEVGGPAAGVERRRATRRPKKFVVRFRVIGGPLPKDIADRSGQVVNVSQGGLLLLSKRPLPAGTVLDLKIPENVFGGGAAALKGVVRRADAETEAGDHPVGLLFVRVKPPAGSASAKTERRHDARAAQKLLIKVRGANAGLFHEFEPRGAMLLNLSASGLEVSTTRDYAPGTELEVSLPESALGPARKGRAKVVWSRPGEKDGLHRLGLAFRRP